MLTGLSASVSAWPLNVAVSLARPASPSKVSSPALVVTAPVAGVWKGAIVVEKVCVGVDRAEPVVDVQAPDRLRVVAVGDEQRPAGEAVRRRVPARTSPTE